MEKLVTWYIYIYMYVYIYKYTVGSRVWMACLKHLTCLLSSASGGGLVFCSGIADIRGSTGWAFKVLHERLHTHTHNTHMHAHRHTRTHTDTHTHTYTHKTDTHTHRHPPHSHNTPPHAHRHTHTHTHRYIPMTLLSTSHPLCEGNHNALQRWERLLLPQVPWRDIALRQAWGQVPTHTHTIQRQCVWSNSFHTYDRTVRLHLNEFEV